MKCSDPILCYTRGNGTRAFRHWSLTSQIEKIAYADRSLIFNCGQCLHCRKKRAYELACRCVLHASLYKDNCFITLTYDEKKETYHNVFQYSDIQKFKKRLRSYIWRHFRKRSEIFNVHEYGKAGKKHWHLVVFNYDPSDKKIFSIRNNIPLYTSEILSTLWPFGFSTVGSVTEASAMYQSQYVQKDLKNGNTNNSKKSHSKHSGIARKYFLLHYQQLLTLGYVPINGFKLPLPRYFQKLAHKHYSHFYEPENFVDTKYRKALHRTFKRNEQNKHIADLYIHYKEQKKEFLLDLEKEWNKTVLDYLTSKRSPDFIKSGENAIHDLNNKLHTGAF